MEPEPKKEDKAKDKPQAVANTADESADKLKKPTNASKSTDKQKTSKKESTENQQSSTEKEEDQQQQQSSKQPPSWFEIDEERNTNVYVSNLPSEITNEEFIELMQKCGLILKDPETNKYKIKLYRNRDGTLKGDGLCTYIKQESVTLALQILDGYLYNDKEIKVERAKFELKGEYDPSKKPRKRRQEDKEKQKKKLTRLFDWQEKEPAERSKREKVVIIKNLFDPAEFDKDPTLIAEYKQEVEEECSEKCGAVKKVELYDRNPEGVVAVFFKEFEHADLCVGLMNGRFYAGRQLFAENWDGRTKYKVKETEEEEKRRLEEWNKFLEGDD